MLKLKNIGQYKHIILLGALIAIAVVFIPMEYFSLFFIVLLGLFLGIFVIIFSCKEKKEFMFLLGIFIIAFLARIIASLFIHNFAISVNNLRLLGDAELYSENGYRILQMWLGGTKDLERIYYYVRSTSRGGTLGEYDFYNAFIYFFTGKSPLAPVFINCFAGAITILFVYDITKKLSNARAAIFSGILAAFWPSTFMWSAQNLKEPLLVTMICMLMWSSLEIRKRFRFYLVALALICITWIKIFRPFLLLIFFMFVLPLAFVATSRFKRIMALFIFLIACVAIFVFIDKIKSYLPSYLVTEGASPLEWLHQTRSYRTYGRTAFLSGWDIRTLPVFIVFLPLAFMSAWLAPFPWQMGSLNQIMSMPEMLGFYILIPCMIYGMKFIIKNKFKDAGIILFYIFIVSFILAVTEGNIGTLLRHKSMIMPFCFVLIAIGMDKYNFRIIARHKE